MALVYDRWVRQLADSGRQYTTNAGSLIIRFASCPTCGAQPRQLCRGLDRPHDETYGIHAARRTHFVELATVVIEQVGVTP